MPVDAKLFITCGEDRFLNVVEAVSASLNRWVREKLDEHIAENHPSMNRFQFLMNREEDAKNWSHCVSGSFYNEKVFSLNFSVFGESRSLHLLPRCGSDYSDTFKGPKIILSIGHWGHYDEIMKVVIESLKSLDIGDVYYDFNDCDDKGFVKQ